MKWTEEEIELIKNKYKEGTEEIKLENRTLKSIRTKARRLGLKVKTETKSRINRDNAKKKAGKQIKYKVNEFLNDIDEYSSYVIGLLWTDGYLHTGRKTLNITMLKEDLVEIDWIFNKLGEWYIQDRKRKNRRESRTLSTYNPRLSNQLTDFDFKIKSTQSPYLVFDLIPKKYQKYFFRGIIDGDGCFYVSEKNSTYQFSIASTYEQDWSFYLDFFHKKGLNPIIKKRIQKSGKSSYLRITGRKQVLKLIEWLYEGYDNDKIGLKRKFEKSLLFKK
jgi:hypothetical protein